MRQNRLKQIIADGGIALGTTLAFPCPELVEACGLLGFDYVFIDGEHDGFGPRDCQLLAYAADAVGITPMARVPRNDPETILGYLETGVQTIAAPHVNTAADARAGIAAVRYPPDGVRGAGSATRAANYGITQSAAEYFAGANSQTLFLPILEEAQAFERIDEILEVPGLEAILIGPGDLALSMGYPGQMTHPAVQEVVLGALKKARAAGIWVGTATRDAATTKACLEAGFQGILASSGSLFVDAVRRFMRDSGLEERRGARAG